MAAVPPAGGQSPTSLSRTLERVFEEAQHTGEINLSGRKLKEYPKVSAKYDLGDSTLTGRFYKFGIFFCSSNSRICPILFQLLTLSHTFFCDKTNHRKQIKSVFQRNLEASV